MNEIIKTLKKATIKSRLQKMGIKHLGLVGSYSKDKQTTQSDIDFVYEKKNPNTFSLFERYEVQAYLKSIFKKEVDLISKNSIHPLFKESILSSQIDIF
jgi:uncharacterized protein